MTSRPSRKGSGTVPGVADRHRRGCRCGRAPGSSVVPSRSDRARHDPPGQLVRPGPASADASSWLGERASLDGREARVDERGRQQERGAQGDDQADARLRAGSIGAQVSQDGVPDRPHVAPARPTFEEPYGASQGVVRWGDTCPSARGPGRRTTGRAAGWARRTGGLLPVASAPRPGRPRELRPGPLRRPPAPPQAGPGGKDLTDERRLRESGGPEGPPATTCATCGFAWRRGRDGLRRVPALRHRTGLVARSGQRKRRQDGVSMVTCPGS